MWVFGYGSLIWRAGFPHRGGQPCFIQGYQRRFWQASTDHRGVPEAPGRVVTLERRHGARCWGMAYDVADQDAVQVLATLDHREKGGYSRALEPVRRSAAEAPFADALLYIAEIDNADYLGPAPLSTIAGQVLGATGPSGSNLDYVCRLAAALRAIAPEDAALFDGDVLELDRLLREASSERSA
jgi:cation transport protein ChaC